MLKFVVFSKFTLRGKRWFFRIVAKNGEIIAQSEAYVRRIDAQRALTLIATSARHAEVIVHEQ